MPGTPEYRSRTNVAKKMGYKHIHPIQEWSSKFRWQERANAIDEWEMRILKTEELKQKIAMRKRHIALAQQVQQVGEAKLKEIIGDIENGIVPDIDYSTLYKLIEPSLPVSITSKSNSSSHFITVFRGVTIGMFSLRTFMEK